MQFKRGGKVGSRREQTGRNELRRTAECEQVPRGEGLWWFQAYPVEEKYSFWKNWEGGHETGLVKLVKELAVKG